MICNLICEECTFDDCINDDITEEEMQYNEDIIHRDNKELKKLEHSKEKMYANIRRYQRKHKKEISEWHKKYYQEHKEHIKEMQRINYRKKKGESVKNEQT